MVSTNDYSVNISDFRGGKYVLGVQWPDVDG